MSGLPAGLSFTAPEWNSFGLELLGGTPLSQAFTAVRGGAGDAIVISAARNGILSVLCVGFCCVPPCRAVLR